MRADLDAVETRLATRYGEVVTVKADVVLALVAELRAAREAQRVDRLLIRELRPFIERDHASSMRNDEYWQALVNARSSLHVYDKVTGEAR